jgi:hypothetical protein
MTPIEKTSFLSPRNVPLWIVLVMVAIFAALIFGHR